MDLFTHMLMAILPSILLLGILPIELLILIWVMTFLPDLDVFIEPFHYIKKSYYLLHKTTSHSYIVGFIISIIAGAIVYSLMGISFILAVAAGFFGYSIHVSLDLFATSRIPIFYPLSKKEYRFTADRAINPLIAAFSGFILLRFLLLHLSKTGNYEIYINLAYTYLIIYFLYFSSKAIPKIWLQLKISENSIYLPGILPFFCYIYEHEVLEDKETFSLTKKFIFSHKDSIILNKVIQNNTKNMFYYKKAKEISQKYRFFYKWEALIPIIRENDTLINIILLLTESLSAGTCYFSNTTFDKATGKVIKQSEGFDFMKKWEKPI